MLWFNRYVIHVLEKGRPILFSFLILDQEEHGQAKTMRKKHKTQRLKCLLHDDHQQPSYKKEIWWTNCRSWSWFEIQDHWHFGKREKYDCKSFRGAPSIVLPDAKDGWQGQDHGKRQNKVQPPTSIYKMQKMIPCSKYSRLGRCKFCLVPMSGMRKMRKKTTPRQLNHPVIHPPITPFS